MFRELRQLLRNIRGFFPPYFVLYRTKKSDVYWVPAEPGQFAMSAAMCIYMCILKSYVIEAYIKTMLEPGTGARYTHGRCVGSPQS
jgi:hypothetical protein